MEHGLGCHRCVLLSTSFGLSQRAWVIQSQELGTWPCGCSWVEFWFLSVSLLELDWIDQGTLSEA